VPTSVVTNAAHFDALLGSILNGGTKEKNEPGVVFSPGKCLTKYGNGFKITQNPAMIRYNRSRRHVIYAPISLEKFHAAKTRTEDAEV